MAVAKLFVAAVAALSFTLPVVSAPIPRFDSPSLQFYHARSHHVAVVEHKRDLAARGVELSSTSSELKRGGDADETDEDCSETDSEDGDDDEDDETCPEGYELEEVDEDDDEDCSDAEEDDVATEDNTKSVNKVDEVVDLNTGKTTTVTTTSRPTTTSKPPAAKKTSSTTSATPTPTPKASNSNKSTNTSPAPGQFSGTGTWYEQHGVAGACGKVNPDSAFIGAMNGAQFKGSCGKKVLIKNKANGKTVTITIADECPSKFCKHGNIDLSVAAFKSISSLDKGVVDMEWSFI